MPPEHQVGSSNLSGRARFPTVIGKLWPFLADCSLSTQLVHNLERPVQLHGPEVCLIR
jgi:hypothetical protein